MSLLDSVCRSRRLIAQLTWRDRWHRHLATFEGLCRHACRNLVNGRWAEARGESAYMSVTVHTKGVTLQSPVLDL
eukprot:514087-Rhodomonas_salina.2